MQTNELVVVHVVRQLRVHFGQDLVEEVSGTHVERSVNVTNYNTVKNFTVVSTVALMRDTGYIYVELKSREVKRLTITQL